LTLFSLIDTLFPNREKVTMGIKCPKCHFDNPSDSKFCKVCDFASSYLVDIIENMSFMKGT